MPDFSPSAFRSELVLDPDVRYMNVGTSGPWPRRSLDAQCEYLRWSSARGPGSYEAVKRYFGGEADLRRALARFFGGRPGQYVLTHSTSEGINIVLNGFDFRPGDEIVTTDLEHSGLVLPVYHKAKGSGLGLKVMRLLDGRDPLEEFERLLTPRTRLLVLSHVSYIDGWVLPLERLIERAHEAGVAVLSDAAQSAGQFPLRLDALGADFVAIPGQKWLLGPEGTGTLYLHGDWAQRLRPDRVGWAGDMGFDFEGNYRLKPSAAKFEVATRDPAALLALKTSLEFLEEHGPSTLAERIREVSALARDGLKRITGVRLLGPEDPEAGSGLIAFRIGDLHPPRVVKHLWESAGIVTRWIPEPHPPAVRVSLHAFVTDDDVNALLAAVRTAESHVDPAPMAVAPFLAEWDREG
ncbi:MAG: aminotransferase class V-fold PLP-dependent enzyme [Armatimonadetes bacterium]|nr:aminotransferase class V-fold PLP-dependent enzyme [Armatimonadota bacterium]